jgi:hypothetical protein
LQDVNPIETITANAAVKNKCFIIIVLMFVDKKVDNEKLLVAIVA